MKLGVAGLSHETITFQPSLTYLEAFEKHVLRGAELIEARRGTETYEGGFIDICDAAGVELFPVCETFGGVSGIVADSVYDHYMKEMRDEFAKVAGKLDGILLSLQGNIVTESLEETESHIAREIRRVMGHEIPIMAAMDLHANISRVLLDWTTAICADQAMPHIDKREVGRRTARVMLATLRKEIKPTIAMAKPGVVVPSTFSNTFVSPGKYLVEKRQEWEDHRGVIDISIFFGFAWADVPQLGMTMVAITDDDSALAQKIVEDLAEYAWQHRRELVGADRLLNVKEGVALAIERAKSASKPVFVVDPANRSCDTTFVLRELISQRAQNAAIPVFLDPESAKACVKAGLGNEIELRVGGRTGWRDGGPFTTKAKILWAGESTYIGRGMRSKRMGTTVTRPDEDVVRGATAIIDTNGIWLQLTSYKSSLVNTDAFTQFGYDPKQFDIIVARSYEDNAFSEIADSVIMVDSPGQCPANLSLFDWKNIPFGVYPITAGDEDRQTNRVGVWIH